MGEPVCRRRWRWGSPWPPSGSVQPRPGRRTRPGRRAAVAAGQRADFAGRVEIRAARCTSSAAEGVALTVVLEAGTGDLGDVWSIAPSGPGRAVLPAVARFTRVCAYDRPGTYLLPDRLSRSDPVAMPRSARDVVLDLRALARRPRSGALRAGRPLVRRPDCAPLRHHLPPEVAGLVSIDAQNEDFAAAYKQLLTPEQYAAAVLNPQPPQGLEDYARRGAARPRGKRRSDAPGTGRHAAAPDAARRPLPLPHPPNPFGFPSDWPLEALERAFQESQDKLAGLVPGARHVIAAGSGHYIQLDQPRLVTREIRRAVVARSR